MISFKNVNFVFQNVFFILYFKMYNLKSYFYILKNTIRIQNFIKLQSQNYGKKKCPYTKFDIRPIIERDKLNKF